MILFEKNEMCIRELVVEDAALLHRWLSNPTVLEYYGGRDRPYDMELVQQHFYEDRDEINQCIIQFKNEDIGYIQFYLIDDEEIEKYDYRAYVGKIYGMDQFIGETSYWNQEIGFVMDPQAWNERALRVYERNGFIKKKYLEKYEWHEGEFRDCWLIEYEV